MSIETMTKLATVTVGSGGSTYVEFTNIPQTYTDLKIYLSARTTKSTVWDELKLSFNPPNSNYVEKMVYGDGTNTGSVGATSNRRFIIVCGDTATTNTFGSAEQYIFNYTSSGYKTTSIDSVTETNATTAYQYMDTIMWQDTAPITSIRLESNNSATFKEFTTATLYGVMNARKTAGNSVKATGGNISFDGTYVIHTFNTSGTFTPTAALTADYLVVAGGGGGGRDGGGGGGAGGLRSTVNATGGGGSLESALSLTAYTAYTVTVGAGGAGSAVTTDKGSNGSNSVFSTITSTGGGGGGSAGVAVRTGANGGSGGGARMNTASSGGAATSNQGYAGGSSASAKGSGGGGGAGAVGADGIDGPGSALDGGNGGAGVAVAISGSSVTYAGGGGGGAADSASAVPGTGGAGGGGAGGRASSGVAGTANTGGGGGGDGGDVGNASGGAGGSGVVIIRYKA